MEQVVKKYGLLIILGLTALAFTNIFSNEFVIDDRTFVIEWEAAHSLSNLPELLRGAVPAGHEGVYRPLRSLLYALYYQIWGSNPFGYHLHSLIVHLLSTTLVYLIVKKLTRTNLVAFIAGLLFGLHPVHTESITYISASMEMTGVVFFLASFYLYLKGRLWPSIIFATLAFFTYEVTLVLIPLIILHDLTFGRVAMKSLSRKIGAYVPYTVLTGIYLFVRIVILGIRERGDYAANSFFLSMLATIEVFVRYLKLTIFPLQQAHNHLVSDGIEAVLYRGYSRDQLKILSFFDSDILIGVLLLGLLIGIIVYFRRRLPIISFGIGWFFITLLPAANLIPQYSLMHEKFLYIPSLGFILATIGASETLFKRRVGTVLVITLLIAAGFFFLTYQRNGAWKDEMALWGSDIQTYSGQNAYAHFQLGNAYWNKNDTDESIKQYQEAFKINPHFAVAAASAARSYQKKGDLDTAIEYYYKAIGADPKFWEGYINLANIYLGQGKKELSADQYKKVLEVYPDFDLAREKLASLGSVDILNKKEFKGDQLVFSYPEGWKVSSSGGIVTIAGAEGFAIEFSIQTRGVEVSVEKYLRAQTSETGTLLNQGAAQVPNVDSAYVRIWNDKGVQKDEFFLFKADRVVRVLVYPADSLKMREFDEIISSLTIR